MRRLERRGSQTDEEESVFVTMTDMTVSFLFIIMILLAFFAAQISDEDTIPMSLHEVVVEQRNEAQAEVDDLTARVEMREARIRDLEAELVEMQERLEAALNENERLDRRNMDLEQEIRDLRARVAELEAEIERLRAINDRLNVPSMLEDYLSAAIFQRRELLVELRDLLLLEFPDLQVVISAEQDALRFQGEGLFRSGSSRLAADKLRIVQTMGRLLDEILACYTLGDRARRGSGCDSGDALIEAVQIEGHTDNDGSDTRNLRLSTDRANTTFIEMVSATPELVGHVNLRTQPVLSVSGYGEMRPIVTNETDEGKSANRRIDLRIIMYAPSDVEEVEKISRRLDRLRAAGGEE